MHVANYQTCNDCHETHGLQPKVEACQGCHQVDNPENIRQGSPDDYDGDGNTTEGVAEEIATMKEALYTAMQDYAATQLNKPIVYDPANYPYYYNDLNGNGQVDAEELNAQNRYATWSPRLLRAAYNYQYVTKDPGAYAHNATYIMQVLYDSIQDVGGSVQDMIRPPATGQGASQ